MAKVTRRNQSDSDHEDVNDFSGETPYSDKELSKFRELLLTEKKAVLQRIGAHVNQATEDQENLADEVYLDHLSGYNRNAASDVAVGERLPGVGRSAFVRIGIVS